MSKPKRAPPLSVRLGPKERERLEQDAGEMSLASYIRSRLFDPTVEPGRKHMKRGQFPVKDHQALAQLMGLLGQSRIANNVNQLARAANTGTLPVTPETEAELQSAARDIADLRALLLKALGLSEAS